MGKAKQRRAQNNPLKVWVDAAYYKENGRAGGAAVIMGVSGQDLRVAAYNLEGFDVETNNEAELWSTAVALRHLPPGSVTRLFTDSAAVESALRKFQRGEFDKINLPKDLFQVLGKMVERQPYMRFQRMKRKKGRIPMADAFAGAVAARDPASSKQQECYFGRPVPMFFVTPEDNAVAPLVSALR